MTDPKIYPTHPTPADILATIAELEAGHPYIDPLINPIYWHCFLYDPEGRLVSDGCAESAAAAMAMAWIIGWAPDAFCDLGCDGVDDFSDVPLIVPPGWRFELTPPALHAPRPEMPDLQSSWNPSTGEDSHGSS